MFFLALLSSVDMPFVALCITKLQFAYYGRDDPNFDDWEGTSKIILTLMGCWMVSLFFLHSFKYTLFGTMGEKLTFKLRMLMIEEIMHKQISWFDNENRAPGIITDVISSNIVSLNGMTSEVVVTLFELVCVVIIGMSAGIYFSW